MSTDKIGMCVIAGCAVLCALIAFIEHGLNMRYGYKYRIVSKGNKYIIQEQVRVLPWIWSTERRFDEFVEAKSKLEKWITNDQERIFNSYSKSRVVAEMSDLTPDQQASEIIHILDKELQ